jgi:acetolactate synthase-1/2/3 large subunit
MRGADLVVRALAEAGARTVFTLSGNQIMSIFDACIDHDLRLVHVRHEAAAVFMAEAWAQLTGEIGVALVTAGPGFANALSPLLAARASETPVLLLSGDSPCAQDGQGAFQELDQMTAARPFTKATSRASATASLGQDVARAIRRARSARPGPVHLALPVDLLTATADHPVLPGPDAFAPEQPAPLEPALVRTTAEQLAAAARPLILTGPALNPSRAGPLLAALGRRLDLPVVPMESPRGLKDPALGAFADTLAEADLILALGRPIDFVLGFARPPALAEQARLIVIDPEPGALDRAHRLLGPRLALAARADPEAAGRALIDRTKDGPARRAGWRNRVEQAIAWRGDLAPGAPAERPRPWDVGAAVQALLERAEAPLLVVDGGEFGQWAQATIRAPRRIINGPGGAIGGGLPYAIAARLAHPEATVVALVGDGTLGFHLAEFETAVRIGTPFVLVVGNDARWNAEHQLQLRAYGPGRLIGCDLLPARYDRTVAALGGHGEHVDRLDQLGPALERALASGLPACVDVALAGHPAPVFAGGRLISG